MTTDNNGIRILVKHSEPIFAMGLVTILSRMPDFDMVGDDATSARAAGLDVIVCDCDYDASLQHTGGAPGAGMRVVVVARKPRGFEIQEAIGRGVLGYVAASCSTGELESAVRAASRGRRFLCQAAAQEVANGLTAESLTSRERDVLQLLAQGRCNKTIANLLDIAVGTVKAHVCAILTKLEASSRTEAASIAVARGLLPEPTLDDAAIAPRRHATLVAPRVGHARDFAFA